MEDKIFDLIEKMYVDLKNEIRTLSDKVETIGNQTTKLENKLDNNSKALFDGYNLVYEKLQEHDKRFDSLESKVDNINAKVEKQEVEIRVIKGGK